MRRDTRGVSTVLSHTLALGVIAILIVGLVAGVGGFFDDQQGQARAQQLDVVGDRVASDVARADRLAADGGSVTVDASGPADVAGSGYALHLLTESGDTVLYVNASASSDSSRIALRTTVPVCESHAYGGSVSVVVENGCISIEDR